MAYKQLKDKAKKLGIILIGDLPFYLSICSPLVWANQEIFQLEKDGELRHVSGIPNGPRALFGRQIWWHPLYNWGSAIDSNRVIDFWEIRLKYMAHLFDYVRFDYAKGFFQYGVIDITKDDNDHYKKGPGDAALEELVRFNKENGVVSFVEDCGRNLQPLRQSMTKMKINRV